VACDPKDGTVTLDNGEIIHADVVIGADGIHVCMFLDRPMGS
jgi:2-polyprenyl-6-methoxyphenol hydroxylase-like FAD-dependent oxidoreductase